MDKEYLEHIDEIINKKIENEGIKSSEEYKKKLNKLNEINNNINVYPEEQRKNIIEYQQNLLFEIKKYNDQYNMNKKEIINDINEIRAEYESSNRAITEEIEKLNEYRDNIARNIYNEQQEIKNEFSKNLSAQDFDIIQKKNDNLKLFNGTLKEINNEIIKNTRIKFENEKILKKLNYDEISKFSDEIAKLKKVQSGNANTIAEDVKDSYSNVKNENNIMMNMPSIQKNEEKVDNNNENIASAKLRILVNDKGYCVQDAVEAKDINCSFFYKKKRKKIEMEFYGEDYQEIMDSISNKKAQKSYDPNLLKILYNKLGKSAALKYLQELSNGKLADKASLPYEITYDIKSIKKNKQLNTRKKLKSMIKIVRRNRYVANVIDINRKRALKSGITALLAAGMATLTSGQAIINNTNDKTDNCKEQNNTLSDSILTEENETQAQKETQEESKKEFVDSIKIDKNNNVDIAQKRIDETLNKLKEFELGDKVNLEEGVNYTEDSLGGGDSGTIGKIQWRPAGDYVVNGVSIIDSSNNEIITYSFGNDQNGNKDSNFNLNKYLKENVKKGMEIKFHIDKDGTKPTGWIDSSNIIKSLEMEKKQNEQIVNIDFQK